MDISELKVSVIIPIYNVEKYLRRCLDSVINQTLKEIEIILVDDGSTDSSGEICEEYKAIDNRIIVIHKKNGGLSSARNAGLDVAKARFVGFVDSDDWIDENYYLCLYEIACRDDTNVVTCLYKVCADDREKNKKTVVSCNKKGGIEFREDFLRSSIKGGCTWVPAWSKIYKRELISDIRFEEGKIYEDVMFNWRVFNLDDCKVSYCNYKGYYYFNNMESITKSSFSHKMYDLFYVADFLDATKYQDSNKEIDYLIEIFRKKISYSILIKMMKSNYKNKEEKNIYLEKVKKDYKDLMHSDLSMTRKILLMAIKFVPMDKLEKVINRLG